MLKRKAKDLKNQKKKIIANTFPTEASDACNHAKGKKNVKGIRTEKKRTPMTLPKINNIERIEAPDTLRRTTNANRRKSKLENAHRKHMQKVPYTITKKEKTPHEMSSISVVRPGRHVASRCHNCLVASTASCTIG